MDCSPPGSSGHGDSPGKNPPWVAMPSSMGSFQPRDRTQASSIAGRFFTREAIHESRRQIWVASLGDPRLFNIATLHNNHACSLNVYKIYCRCISKRHLVINVTQVQLSVEEEGIISYYRILNK